MERLVENNPAYAIVATTRYLLLVNLNSKNVVPLEGDRPEYYGISWFPGDQDLTLSHSALDTTDLIDLSGYALSEVGFISRGSLAGHPFLSAPHQVLCAPDGRIICANTGRNSISVFDPGKPTYIQEARISPARWDRLSLENIIGDHLNSVFVKEDLLYVIAHGHNKGSVLATLSYPDLQLIALKPIKNRTGLHNIWVTGDGQEIICHSEAGALIDLSTDAVLWESGSPIYTRGLAAASDFVLVGESQKTTRDLRRSSMSGLWLLDRKTWRALEYFCLGPYGAVNEVRLLNVADEAHHGQPFCGLATLLARDIRSAMAEDRMRMSSLAQKNRTAWSNFELVFGSPIHGDQGARRADAENLCLITQNMSADKSDRQLDFSYSLDGLPGKSHFAVVTYQGTGGDTHMDAILIQRINETEAQLNPWTHDGTSWAVHPEIAVGELPLAGNVKIHTDSTNIDMFINDQRIISLPLDDMPSHRGSLGIRWIGATISRPKDFGTDA